MSAGQWLSSPTGSRSLALKSHFPQPPGPQKTPPSSKLKTAPLKRFLRQGFSLVELITVVAIVGIITALVVPAVNGFGRSTALNSGGNMVANLAGLARQTAMSKNTLAALVVVTNLGTEQDYRAMTVAEYRDGIWQQVTKWETLPTGIVVDTSSESTFLTNTPVPFPFKLGIVIGNRRLDDASTFAARIFLSNGSLQNADKAAQLRIVEGFRQGAGIAYTHRGTGNQPANYYDIAIIGTTGIAKISRP